MSLADRAEVAFGREICGELEEGLRREWLVTNGLGGYASGTLAGPLTRRYHGLLVAALAPPADRRVFVAGLTEWVDVDGESIALHGHEFADGTIDQRGWEHIESFHLDGPIPTWRFAIRDLLIEKRIVMEHGANTTWIEYALVRGDRPIHLRVTPLATDRDHHVLAVDDGEFAAELIADGIALDLAGASATLSLTAEGLGFVPEGVWYRRFRHREELARGLDAESDLLATVTFEGDLAPDARAAIRLSVDGGPAAGATAAAAFAAALERDPELEVRAGARHGTAFLRGLVRAADQCVVRRDLPVRSGDDPTPSTPTIIAGYPWFGDWGRDTMIALPGLLLATEHPDEAADTLRAFARLLRQGLLPNDLPDRSDGPLHYNTVDAPLWFIQALRAWTVHSGPMLADELLPSVFHILNAYSNGTDFGIGVDPADGLLRAGVPGQQLTWMDARVGDVEVTPRIGKPVEINALWYSALRWTGEWLALTDPDGSAECLEAAEWTRASFCARFWDPARGHLADVVDGPDGDDWTIRPNQIFALSLPDRILGPTQEQAVLDTVAHSLSTTLGLRSLAPGDPRYRGRYSGSPEKRDGAYHQGTAWTWLMGPFAEAWARLRDRTEALEMLEAGSMHFRDAGLGSLSELTEGDSPHRPRGAIAQAWSLAGAQRHLNSPSAAPRGGLVRGSPRPVRPCTISPQKRQTWR